MKNILMAILVLIIAGCAHPVRSDVSEFELKNQGSIPQSQVAKFADCLHDGFESRKYSSAIKNIKRQRRSDSVRIERIVADGLILMSADVFDDGRVALYESSAALLINTSGERNAFDACLKEFAAK